MEGGDHEGADRSGDNSAGVCTGAAGSGAGCRLFSDGDGLEVGFGLNAGIGFDLGAKVEVGIGASSDIGIDFRQGRVGLGFESKNSRAGSGGTVGCSGGASGEGLGGDWRDSGGDKAAEGDAS